MDKLPFFLFSFVEGYLQYKYISKIDFLIMFET